MRKAYSFVRFSRIEQAKGDSLRRQKKMTETLCERNGWQLTHLEPMQGKSAFRGKQRATGPLAEFLEMAENGQIERGSILIVESLDRLTREQVRTAVKFFLSILDTGIDIVTTNPEYHFTAEAGNSELVDIIIAVVFLSRAYEESATKSRRLKEAWAEKRKNGTVKKMTHSCPAWLRYVDGAFQTIAENVKTVKRIFDMAINGYGVFRISRALNKEGIPTFGNKPNRKAERWYESYIIRILQNRAVIGEFQPCIRDENNRSVPSSEPIPKYYPAIISEKIFNDARMAISERATGVKRTGAFVPNLFSKLIRDARDGAGYLYIPSKKKCAHAHLEPGGGRNGTALPISFRYQPIENAFLKYLSEISSSDLTKTPQPENRLDALKGRIADLDGRIATVKKKMDTDANLDILLDKLSAWQAERNTVLAELDAEKQRIANPVQERLQDAKSLITLLRDADGEDRIDLRTRLKQRIRSLVSEIWMLVYEIEVPGSRGRVKTDRAAILQVHFHDGHYRSIDIVPDSEGCDWFAARENGFSGWDLREYRKAKLKRFDKPIWYANLIEGKI